MNGRKGTDGKPLARIDQYRDAETAPELPECCVSELIDVLMDAGPRMIAGMGEAPLSAQELLAWCAGTGQDLTPWEFATVLQMSRAYAGEYQAAQDPNAPAPWNDPDMTQAKRKMVATGMRELMRAARAAQMAAK